MTLSIRPYQADGIEFLVERRRAALWDRPGLGKSMQALLAMNYLVGDGARILVVATGDAVGVWQDETAKWLDEEAAVFAGPGANAKALDHEGVVIVNYHRMGNALGHAGWDGVIFDESQMLRNRNTETLFKTVKWFYDSGRIERGAYKRVPTFFLSGTPVVKHAGDVWPILHLIDKVHWRSYWAFVKRYCIVWQDQFGWHVEGITNLQSMWDELATISLRREKVKDSPGRMRQRVPLTMTPMQKKAYKQLERDMYAELDDGSLLLTPTVLARETRLRQILACPRILGIDDDGAALHMLRDVAERTTDPFVVFTPFAEAMKHAASTLSPLRPVFSIRGGMGNRFREVVKAYLDSAANGEGPVLLSTVQMAKSWDVTAAAHECYMLGVDWNDTTMDQAESRLDRDGQSDLVLSHYLVHEGSHDMEALEILAGKRKLAGAILDRRVSRRFRAGK